MNKQQFQRGIQRLINKECTVQEFSKWWSSEQNRKSLYGLTPYNLLKDWPL